MDAADFFINKSAGRKSPLNRNQFGSTLGGPILRDRTFFFLSYEGFRQVAPQVSATRVPAAAERAMVIDPISRRCSNSGGTQRYRQPELHRKRAGTEQRRHGTGPYRPRHRRRGSPQRPLDRVPGSAVTAGTTPLSGGDLNTPLPDRWSSVKPTPSRQGC